MITIHIAGSEAEALAAEAGAFLHDVAGEAPERTDVPADDAPARGDPIAIATLVLAVPGAVISTWDFAQRVKLAERVDRLLAAIRRRAGGGARADLTVPGQPPLDLTRADRDTVIDTLTRPPS